MIARFPGSQSIGKDLRAIRLMYGDFLKEAAAKTGYTMRIWIYWEKGQSIPSDRAMVAITKAYPEAVRLVR